MTDQDKELRMRISMLMDSNLDPRDNPRLIERLETDAELKATWARYSLIGDYLRSPQGIVADKDFASRVSLALAEEPTILAPRAIKSPRKPASAKVISLSLAASLAVMAIVVGKSLNDHVDVIQTANNDKAATTSLAENHAGENESRFNDYLVMHNETASMAGSAGMLPYVRVAGSHAGR